MDVFQLRDQLVGDYREFTSSFVAPKEKRLAEHVAQRMDGREQWPDPWLSLNPNFAPGGTIPELVREGLLHPECERIFRVKQDRNDPGGEPLRLYRHQRDAVEAARTGESYVLTTGTGSGKSLAYVIPIVDRVLRERDAHGPSKGVKAIVVYPMNALANSQVNELEKFLERGYPKGGEPVTFARYTGQEPDEKREEILADPPDILLTNYVMLDLVLTRPKDHRLVRAARGLRFAILDELHSYRGRQGADVAMLARRLRDACDAPNLQVVGTSATMSTADTLDEQRRQVADVATRLFGAEVAPERVIGETLRRVTPPQAATDEALAERVTHPRPPGGHDELAADPLMSWIETTFGVRKAPDSDRLIRQHPRQVLDAAAELARRIDLDYNTCLGAIKSLLEDVSRVRELATGRAAFAFRLHQFLSKGSGVYVSVEPPSQRYITSRYQTVAPGAPDKALLPVAFCRECGQEYLTVSRVERHGRTRYVPRQDNDASGGDWANGYLYISDEHPWPATREAAIEDGRLPDSWLATDQTGRQRVVQSQEKHLPRVVHVDVDGGEADAGVQAAFVREPFPFCLSCRASYEQRRGSDFAKLASLSTEGRSSAASVISSSVVRAMRQVDDPELRDEARKLLAFVDNRQDASLQAGHFNDFAQVTQLRGALHQAMRAERGRVLTHELLAERVTEALGMDVPDFAQNPGAKYGAKEAAERALRHVVSYRLYLDLERGWRVTMPNLEQTGLLTVDYASLPEIAADVEEWSGCHAALAGDTAGHRRELARVVLDELRRVLAIDVDCLTKPGFDRIRSLSGQNLAEPWALPENEDTPRQAGIAYARPGGPGGSRGDLHLSGRSAVGRYLRREGTFPHHPDRLGADDAQQILSDLLRVLERCGLLTVAMSPKDGGAPGYRLKSSAILWRAGDGTSGAPDPVRRTVDAEGPRVNPFFRDLYREMASSLSGLYAREHTAQVHPEERERREVDFRKADLPLLYCSPTMELGVDIADLNAVLMRNVPPTPANYAQRSGRAGRSGQQALVVTYCAAGNAHDQYYFKNAQRMVAGSVAPPRLDLTNEDLLRSHVHAVWLAETGLSLGRSLADLVDVDGEDPSLELRPEVREQLADERARRRAVDRARDLLAGITASLRGTSWWHDGWIERVVRDAPATFDRACDRWRDLYQAALRERERQHRIVGDQSAAKKNRDSGVRRRRDAENQLTLLRNEDSGFASTDFYSYRYFASEGFLPGYSFPRLPLAAYVPGQRGVRGGDGGYLQRPRFLAVREFGPGALVYHEGARYQVTSVQVPRTEAGGAELDTRSARVCAACGYLHEKDVGIDVCSSCGQRLGPSRYGLLPLQTVFTRRRERISSDEEERRRAGFELETSYAFTDHGPRPGRVDAEAAGPEGAALELAYGDTATVRVTNLGHRRRKHADDVGFYLDTADGRWITEKKATERVPEEEGLAQDDVTRARKVIPYVEDRRNILVTRLPRQVDEATATSFVFALERGIETGFQLEDSELDGELLPDADVRGRALFIESAEGGAGVLRRMVDEPDALATAARQALVVAHFDPDTGEDLEAGADDRCERACYDCLLSYRNQRVHELIDRHLVRDHLLALARATAARGGGGVDRDQQAGDLARVADSDLERRFVEWLEQHDYRLPDAAQVLVEEAGARPDFVYRQADANVAVFVDGPHHDGQRAAQRDVEAGENLRDLGWTVVRVRYDDEWADVVRRYPSVFGARSS